MKLPHAAFLLTLLWLYSAEGSLNLQAIRKTLSRIGSNFAVRGVDIGLEDAAKVAGYNFAALGTYWRSNTLSVFAQMKRGEMQEAMETFNLAVSTLAVWDLGQGVAYPVADKLINKIILRYQDDFQRTFQAFKRYRNVIKTSLLDDATKTTEAAVLKSQLLNSKGDIAKSFQLDVESGLSRFKDTKIYGDLVTDLRGIKTWAKAAKWADVFAGPLFDAATVAVSAWQLTEAIKSNNPFAIASSSLSLASGLAGLTGFAVAALATAGSTLAAVAGPIGAIIGAVLGMASIIVEVVFFINPYTQIDKDLSMLNELKKASKKYLDTDTDNLQKLIPSQAKNFSFSWVYELNQGHLLDLRGRTGENRAPVRFRLDEAERMENGYLVVGENKRFDKSRYPDNIFWDPSGIVNLGYDFYGTKITTKPRGVTVILSTDLVADKGVDLKGADVETFRNTEDAMPDSVVIDDFYDLALWAHLKVRTGGGDDVIVINGLIGKPGHRDYPGHKDFRWGYTKVDITTFAKDSSEARKKENNILSLEGMPRKNSHGLLGVYFQMPYGTFAYFSDREGSKKRYDFGVIKGIKMFVGSPYDDVVRFWMDYDYVIRQTRGKNQYFLKTTCLGPFKITIDDQCDEPGKLTIEEGHTAAGVVEQKHLVYSEGTNTLFIYARQESKRWQVRGQIFFNRKPEGDYPMIATEVDGKEIRLDKLPDEFEPKEETESIGFFVKELDYQYHFDRNLDGRCAKYRIFLNPPDFKRGRYFIRFRKRKNTFDDMILKREFVSKCLKKAKRSFHLICTDALRDRWMIRLRAPDGLDSDECPGKDFEIQITAGRFERMFEELDGGQMRLLVDFRTEKRDSINIVTEMKKMDTRAKFYFNEDMEGDIGVPQAVDLEPPSEADPEDGPIRTFIDLKGGERQNEDSLVFTDRLRKWLKKHERKMKLEKEEEGDWIMQIEKSASGDMTHQVRLENVESIVYEPSDTELRVLVIPNLATEVDDNIDLENETRNREQRARKVQYYDRINDCLNID